MKAIKHLLLAILPLVAISLAGCTKDEGTNNNGGGDIDLTNFDLKLELAKSGEDALEILCTPTNEEVPYLVFAIAKDDFKDEYVDEKVLIKDKLFKLRFEARLDGLAGEKFVQYVENLQHKGTQTVRFDELTPSTAYYVYAYANDKEAELIDDNFFIKEFTTTEKAKFNIVLGSENVTDMTAKLTATPNYDTETYFCNYMAEIDYEAIGGDTKVADYWVDYIETERNGAYSNFLTRGNISATATNLVPDTKYIFFAFGMDTKGNVTTDVFRTEFKTAPFQATDNCTFELTTAEVNAGSIVVDITPSSQTTRYYVGLTSADYIKAGYTVPEIAAQFIDQENAYETDWATSEYVYTGAQRFRFYTMADKEYLVLVFGVSTSGVRTTEIAYMTQKTKSVVPSSMTIDMTASDITMNGAKIAIKPSSQTEKYYTGFLTYDAYVNTLNSDDSKIISTLLEYYDSAIAQYTISGNQEVDYNFRLVSDTKYVAFAFGFDGGATTGLYKCEFTTEKAPEGVSDAAVAFESIILDGDDYGYSNKALIIFYMAANASASEWYFGTNKTSLDDISDSDLIAALQNGGQANEEQLFMASDWNTTIYAATVAIDKSGKAGIPQRYTIEVKKEGATTQSAVPELSSVKRMMNVSDIKANKPAATVKNEHNTARVLEKNTIRLDLFKK